MPAVDHDRVACKVLPAGSNENIVARRVRPVVGFFRREIPDLGSYPSWGNGEHEAYGVRLPTGEHGLQTLATPVRLAVPTASRPRGSTVTLVRVKVGEVTRMLQGDGRFLVATRGSHRQFKHATKPGRVTVPGRLSDDLAPGTLNSILKQAGLK